MRKSLFRNGIVLTDFRPEWRTEKNAPWNVADKHRAPYYRGVRVEEQMRLRFGEFNGPKKPGARTLPDFAGIYTSKSDFAGFDV